MMFANVNKLYVNISPNISARRLNLCDYLWNDLEPSIDSDTGGPAGHRIADVIMTTEFKPEGQ